MSLFDVNTHAHQIMNILVYKIMPTLFQSITNMCAAAMRKVR